jgi:radical SAM-linked protein
MSRLLFIKEGVAVWSSHLDLMRALMRSFRRAGIDLKHSQGFTPHPELSILMPLSVGVESQCEIAEFSLAEGCDVPVGEIAVRMAPVLPAGIRALESYEDGQKTGKLAWLRARLELTYDGSGVGETDSSAPLRSAQNDRIEALRTLFARPSLTVQKHSKKGDVEMDIAPMIREIQVGTGTACPPSAVVLEAVVAAQNPTLNPLLLVTAMEKYLPECKPDHVVCRRLEIYDAEMNVFR